MIQHALPILVALLATPAGLAQSPSGVGCTGSLDLEPELQLRFGAVQGFTAFADATGLTDLVAISPNAGAAYWIRSLGGGALAPCQLIYFSSRASSRAFDLGDVDQDGGLDLVLCTFGSSAVAILYGLGDGTFEPPLEFAAGFTVPPVVARDFDLDGLCDIALDSRILSGLGARNFTAPDPPNYAAVRTVASRATADFNRDGAPDFLTPLDSRLYLNQLLFSSGFHPEKRRLLGSSVCSQESSKPAPRSCPSSAAEGERGSSSSPPRTNSRPPKEIRSASAVAA